MLRSRVVPLVAVVLLTGGALTACSGGASGSGGTSADFQSGNGRMASASSGALTSGAASGSDSTATQTDRAIVVTGTLRLVTDSPIAAADRIESLVTAAGGTVASSSEQPEGRASADLTLRIPSAVFDRTLTAIKREGDVRDLDLQSTDVTSQVTDYAVRIANLRTSIGRLQQLLAKATSSSALVDIEGALTDRQTKLEQLLAQQKTLADQVSMATLTVAVVVPAAAPKEGPQDFLGGLVAGWQALVAFGAAAAVGAGVLLPWAVVLGALGAAAAFVVRRARRRTRTA